MRLLARSKDARFVAILEHGSASVEIYPPTRSTRGPLTTRTRSTSSSPAPGSSCTTAFDSPSNPASSCSSRRVFRTTSRTSPTTSPLGQSSTARRAGRSSEGKRGARPQKGSSRPCFCSANTRRTGRFFSNRCGSPDESLAPPEPIPSSAGAPQTPASPSPLGYSTSRFASRARYRRFSPSGSVDSTCKVPSSLVSRSAMRLSSHSSLWKSSGSCVASRSC